MMPKIAIPAERNKKESPSAAATRESPQIGRRSHAWGDPGLFAFSGRRSAGGGQNRCNHSQCKGSFHAGQIEYDAKDSDSRGKKQKRIALCCCDTGKSPNRTTQPRMGSRLPGSLRKITPLFVAGSLPTERRYARCKRILKDHRVKKFQAPPAPEIAGRAYSTLGRKGPSARPSTSARKMRRRKFADTQ